MGGMKRKGLERGAQRKLKVIRQSNMQNILKGEDARKLSNLAITKAMQEEKRRTSVGRVSLCSYFGPAPPHGFL
jgi:hypothetical protein